jgi:hypothetical protein
LGFIAYRYHFLLFLGCVEAGSLECTPESRPAVPATDDISEKDAFDRMIIGRRNRITRRKLFPIANSPSTNTRIGSNPDLRNKKSAINHQSYGMAQVFVTVGNT